MKTVPSMRAARPLGDGATDYTGVPPAKEFNKL